MDVWVGLHDQFGFSGIFLLDESYVVEKLVPSLHDGDFVFFVNVSAS